MAQRGRSDHVSTELALPESLSPSGRGSGSNNDIARYTYRDAQGSRCVSVVIPQVRACVYGSMRDRTSRGLFGVRLYIGIRNC